MADNENLLEAARMIQENCKESCPGKPCPFSRIDKRRCAGTDWCILNGNPREWKIPRIPRWTEADLNMAKALAALGYVKVSKYSGKGQPIARDSLHVTWYLDSGLFRKIEGGETVQLSDIIAEGAEQ